MIASASYIAIDSLSLLLTVRPGNALSLRLYWGFEIYQSQSRTQIILVNEILDYFSNLTVQAKCSMDVNEKVNLKLVEHVNRS